MHINTRADEKDQVSFFEWLLFYFNELVRAEPGRYKIHYSQLWPTSGTPRSLSENR